MKKAITGGYYLKARCIDSSRLAHAPPHAREVFDYFLRRAFWKDGDQLKRGQLLTTYQTIRDDLRWYVGNRPERYKKHQIETAVKLLRRTEAITTAKTTRGMIVTICNYDHYQLQENYESYTEADLNPARNRGESPMIDETVKTGETGKGSTPSGKGFPVALFERFRAVHPDCQRVQDFEFQRVLASHPGCDVVEAVEAFERQLAGAASIRVPLREFEKYLRRSCEKESGGRAFLKKNAAPASENNTDHAVISSRLKERPEGEESQAERMKRKAEERARRRAEAASEKE